MSRRKKSHPWQLTARTSATRCNRAPIEGVGTAVAAFVGLAERDPFSAPTLVSNWSQVTSTFGEFVTCTYLAPRGEDLDLDFCARAFEFSGGAIRSVVVTAAYQRQEDEQDDEEPTAQGTFVQREQAEEEQTEE